MNFPAVITTPCLPTTPPPVDDLCSDPAYALAHPEVCGGARTLILKPGLLLVCTLGSVQFRVFVLENGVETEITEGATFSSSDTDVAVVAVVGVNSGNATGVGVGDVTITAAYAGLTATAKLTVLAGDNCCDQIEVATVLLLDTSKSMGLAFGAGYAQRIDFAKTLAKQYSAQSNTTKDSLGVISFDALPTTVESLSMSTTGFAAAIDGLAAGTSGTGIGLALQAAISMLAGSSAAIKNIVLISDGEDHDTVAADSPAQIAAGFKNQGGLITCVGVRASGVGFNLLNQMATGGFFVNAYPDVAADALIKANGLRGFVCGGNCSDAGGGYETKGALNYSAFLNWDVTAGHVDLIGKGTGKALYDLLPGNGLYVDLAGSSIAFDGTLTSQETFHFLAGVTYQLSVAIAGNQRKPVAGSGVRVIIGDGSILTQDVMTPDYKQDFHTYSFNFTVAADISGQISLAQLRDISGGNPYPSYGNLISQVALSNVTDGTLLFEDDFDDDGSVFVPLACGTSLIPHYSSITLPMIPNPSYFTGDISSTQINSAGGHMAEVLCSGSPTGCFYGVAYLTAQGHTQAAGETGFNYSNSFNAVQINLRTGLDPRILQKVIFREAADNGNPCTGTSTLYVRDIIPASQATYIDLLSDSEWQAIVDRSQIVNNFIPNTTAVDAPGYTYEYSYGYDCHGYGCLTEPVGVQVSDPNPLPDIEVGYVPPTTYTATKSYTAVCPSGTVQSAIVSSIPTLTSDADAAFTLTPSAEESGYEAYLAFTASGAWRAVQSSGFYCTVDGLLPAAAIFVAFGLTVDTTLNNRAVDIQLYGSNDAAHYTIIAEFPAETFVAGTKRTFVVTHPGSYTSYRLGVRPTGTVGGEIGLSRIEYYVSNPAGVGSTGTATATSTISQNDANAKALAAATLAANAGLVCVIQYSSTQSYTAKCETDYANGTLGTDRTMFATRTSLVSQQDADDQAIAAATAAAIALLDCTGSNNSAGITIRDLNTGVPYPSVQYVTGQTGVIVSCTCTVIGFVHTDAGDVQMLLVSPSGTKVALMRNAGVGGGPTPSSTFVFSDAGATMLPAVGPLASGTFKPSQYGVASAFPAPAPATPYLTTMAAFAGEDPNGSWALWVQDIKFLDVGAVNNGFVLAFVTA